MAANSGNDFVLKIGDGASAEAFTTLAGMTSTSMTINNNAVDITTKDSAHARTLLSNGGVKSMSISASGVFTDAAVEDTLRTNATANTLNNYEIVFGNGDKYAGAFLITSYGRSGDTDAAETFDCTLESSGALTFTAA